MCAPRNSDVRWDKGLYEFGLRHDADEILGRKGSFIRRLTERREKILLRVFFHPHGDRLILLVGGYDKGADPSEKRQQNEIAIARKRLAEWRRR